VKANPSRIVVGVVVGLLNPAFKDCYPALRIVVGVVVGLEGRRSAQQPIGACVLASDLAKQLRVTQEGIHLVWIHLHPWFVRRLLVTETKSAR
jgi:hypothetical protein